MENFEKTGGSTPADFAGGSSFITIDVSQRARNEGAQAPDANPISENYGENKGK